VIIQIAVYGLLSGFKNLARGCLVKGCLGVPPARPT
jgi:hypothetical protein